MTEDQIPKFPPSDAFRQRAHISSFEDYATLYQKSIDQLCSWLILRSVPTKKRLKLSAVPRTPLATPSTQRLCPEERIIERKIGGLGSLKQLSGR